MLRAIREIQPRWVVGENVLGIVNWNGGMVFDEVQSDLEAEGYEVQPYVLPACAVNAPHRRDRIWFVAYANKCAAGPSRTSAGIVGKRSGNNDEPKERGKQTEQHFGHGNVYGIDSDTGLQRQAERQKQTMGINELCQEWNVTNAGCSDGCDQRNGNNEKQTSKRGFNALNDFDKATMHTNGERFKEPNPSYLADNQEHPCWKHFNSQPVCFENFPTQSPICSRNDGLPTELVGITLSKHRTESIKSYGNAVVPQVVFQIFKTIQLYEQ